MRLAVATDVCLREHNEDSLVVAGLEGRDLRAQHGAVQLGARGVLMAVCDGMGGASAGEVASRLAADTILARMVEGEVPRDRDELARRLVRAIEQANETVFQEACTVAGRLGMGTTATIAALLDDHLFLGQVGDSRGYILRGGRLVQVTRDQSLVNQLVENGQLTEEEAETFEHSNIILQALGTSGSVQVDLTFVELRRGDVLLLCSDGLSGALRADEIRKVLDASGEPRVVCERLIDEVKKVGGQDNTTCIVVHLDGPGLKARGDDASLVFRRYALRSAGPG